MCIYLPAWILAKTSASFSLKSASQRMTGSKSYNAVLCTQDETYQIRQVQSSNAVFVVQPSIRLPRVQSESASSGSLSAIAQCNITLELGLSRPPTFSILKASLPVWHGTEATATDEFDQMNKQSVLKSVPFSSGEFDLAWRTACAFEFEGKAWLPADSALLALWESMILASTLRGIDLNHAFEVEALYRSIEDTHPRPLYEAVLDVLCNNGKALLGDCEFHSSSVRRSNNDRC